MNRKSKYFEGKNRDFGEIEIFKGIYDLHKSERDTYDIVNYLVRNTSSCYSCKRAAFITNHIMEKVSSFSKPDFTSANGNTLKIIDNYFDSYVNTLDSDVRLFFLHQVRFGLSLYTSDEAVRQLEEGKSRAELFEEYYAGYGSGKVSEDFLKDEIRKILSDTSVSPYYIKKLTDSLNTNNALDFSAATAEDINRLSCIAVAAAYNLSDGGISVDDILSVISAEGSTLEHYTYSIARGEESERRAQEWEGDFLDAGVFFSVFVVCFLAACGVPMVLACAIGIAVFYTIFKTSPLVSYYVKSKASEYAYLDFEGDRAVSRLTRIIRNLLGMSEDTYLEESDVLSLDEENEESFFEEADENENENYEEVYA